MDTFDVVVVGGGPTGENVAARAVRGGLTAALVEHELIGGECSYWACMPSKALLRGTEVLTEARAVDGAKQAVSGEQDVAATLARRDSFASRWDDAGQVEWVRGAGIELIRGVGRLAGERTVVVDTEDGEVRLTARHAVAVCTGSEAAIPPVEGLDTVGAWTPRDATSAKEPPARLLILGGGYVGCEMATAWSALGSQVTLFQRGERLLEGLEPAAAEAVTASLRARGVDVRLECEITAAHRDGAEVVATTSAGKLRGDELLVAVGRRARTSDLGVETVGLEPGEYLDVDATMQVAGLPWLYGVGDVNGRRQLTHMGKYQARQAGAAIVARATGQDVDTSDWSPSAAGRAPATWAWRPSAWSPGRTSTSTARCRCGACPGSTASVTSTAGAS